jgi:hypothetical protein
MNTVAGTPRWLHPLSIGLLVGAALTLSGRTAQARIVKIEITSRETPTFEGRTFGDVGPYEKLRGKAYGEIDPADPRSVVIADIQLAPLNATGKVAYAMDIFILKPIDPGRGNQRLFVDINNRGTMRWDILNSGHCCTPIRRVAISLIQTTFGSICCPACSMASAARGRESVNR